MFHGLARSRLLGRAVSRLATAGSGSFARRFVAGAAIEEALEAALQLQQQGFRVTLIPLGESAASLSEAGDVTRDYVRVIDLIASSGVERHISIRLDRLGLPVDRAICTDNVRRILEAAERHGTFVRLEPGASLLVPLALDLVETLRKLGSRGAGITLRAALGRTEQDIERMNACGIRVLLLRGAPHEPRAIAWQRPPDIDAAFLRQARLLLASGDRPAFATHDAALVDAVSGLAVAEGIAQDGFEFQVRYGVRRDLQQALATRGVTVRVSVPFGQDWFPYLMRTLGEGQASLWSLLHGDRSPAG